MPAQSCSSGFVPGPRGQAGTNGAPGVGINAFTLTAGSGFVVPTIGDTVPIAVGETGWMATGQIIFIVSAGFYQVASITDETDIVATNLGYTGNAVAGTTIAAAQAVVAAGLQGPAGEIGSGVTSVALAVPSWLAVEGSPVTSSGTIEVSASSGQAQALVLATPGSATGAVALIALTSNHLPSIPASKLTGNVATTNGGTGQSSASAGFNALSPTTTKGDLILSNGSGNTRLAVGADGLVLTANSGSSTGTSWSAIPVALVGARREVSVSPDVMQASDVIIGINVAAAVSETLVAAPASARRVTIKDESGAANTNNITVYAGAGDTIQGAASKVISTAYGYLRLYYDAVDKIWFIEGSA